MTESCPETHSFGVFFLTVSEWWLSLPGLPGYQARQNSYKGNSRVNIIYLGGFPGLGDVSQVQEGK